MTANGTRRQTYAQLRDRSHQLAHALRDAGIVVGDRVGTFMWNGSRHLEAYYATAGMGAVLHTLNIRLSDTDLEYIINHAKVRLIIVDSDVLPLLEKLQGKIPSVERVIVATEEGFEKWDTAFPKPVDYEAFIKGKPTRYEWPEIDEKLAARPLLHERHHRQSERRRIRASLAVPAHDGAVHDRLHGTFRHRHAMRHRADVPCARLGPAVVRDDARLQAGDAEPVHGSGAPCRH